MSRAFSERLDDIEHDGSTFLIERHGRPVAVLMPARPEFKRRTWGEVVEALEAGPGPDPDFAKDMEAVIDSIGPMPTNPWDR
jgi:antitoxin (DNA-binding transcriptional repressor) of toxin-antitoxin stability system